MMLKVVVSRTVLGNCPADEYLKSINTQHLYSVISMDCRKYFLSAGVRASAVTVNQFWDEKGLRCLLQGYLSSKSGHPGGDNQPCSSWRTCSAIRGEDSCWTAAESKSERCDQSVCAELGSVFFVLSLPHEILIQQPFVPWNRGEEKETVQSSSLI